MRKNFTQLISRVTRTKSFLIAFTSLMILAGSVYLMAAVGVTVTGTGSYILNADLAAGATFTPLTNSNIRVAEGTGSDFASGQTYRIRLTAPTGWIFSNNATATHSNGGEVTLNTTPTFTSDALGVRTIEFSLTAGNGNQNKLDEIIISGLSIKSTNGAIDPTQPKFINVQVVNTTISTTVASSSPISLSQTPGAVKQLAFITQPSDVLVGESINPAVQVQAKDQFGNIVPSPSVSLALGANPGSGTLIAGASSTSNSIVTFSGYSINKVGIGYTLSASSAGAPSAISNSFTVNNKKPTISNISGCLSAGDPTTAVTITGTNYVSGATVLVNGQSRPATVSNATSLTTSLSAAELSSAGNLSIVVKNPAPAQDNGESEAFSKSVIALQPAGTISGVSEVCPDESNIEFSVPENSAVKFYQWTIVSGNATIASGATSRTARLNFGNTAGSVELSVVAYNTCDKPGAATTRTITIKPTPVVGLSAQDNDTNICQGESVVLSATGASSYVWSGTGIAVGTTGSTLTVTPTATTTYTVIGTTNGCPSAPQTITINVTPALTQGSITGVAEYCHNATATALTASISGGGSASRSYRWEQSSTGNNGTWTQVATTENYTPLTNTVGSTFYKRTVTAGECSLTTSNFEVIVKENPVITVDASDAEICQGETVELTVTGAETYVWSIGSTPISSDAKIDVSPLTTTTYTVVGWTNGCASAPQTIIINVTPALSQGAITGTTQYCQTPDGTGTALQATVSGGDSDKTFRWEQREDGNTAWASAAGANSQANYTPSIATAGTMHYRRVVTSGNCVNVSSSIAVVVTPAVENSIAGDQVICSGELLSPLTGTLLGGLPDDISYLWEQSANGTTGWQAAAGDNTFPSYTPTGNTVSSTTTTHYRRRVISGNCTEYSNVVSVKVTARPLATIVQGANTYFCPTEASGTAPLTASLDGADGYAWYKVGDADPFGFTRTVNVADAGDYYVVVTDDGCSETSDLINVRQTVVNNNVLDNEDELVVCYGATPERLTGSNAEGRFNSVTYQWRVKTTANGSFENISGATNKDLVLGAHTEDRWYQRVASEGGCSIYSNEIKVSVKPELRVTNFPAEKPAVCNGDSYTFTPQGSVEGATFSWTRAASGDNAAASGNGAISETLFNPTTAPIEVTYTYTTSGNENCTGAPQNLTVVVNPTPHLSSSLTPAAICEGTEFDYTATSATTATTFTWVRQSAAGITTTAPASGNGANVEHVLTNTTADPINVTYTYTLTANGCSNTQNVVVRVNPSPQLSSTLSPGAVCNGATFNYTPASDTEDATYSWTRLSASGISSSDPTSGSGSISQALVNNTANPIDVTYRVTTSANGCSGPAQDVVVTVNPSPVLSSALTASICSGATFNYNPTSATEGATFSWTRAANGDNTASNGNGQISEVLTNSTAVPVTVTYQITTSANSCNGTPQNLVVTINPIPELSSPLAASVCSGTEFNYTPSSETANTTYTWTRAAVSGISNAPVTNGTGNVRETLVNTTADPIEVSYTYTLTANGCPNTQDVVVRVNPTPQLSSLQPSEPVCSGSTFNYTAASATDGTTFSWTRQSNPAINGGAVGNGSTATINETLISTSAAPVNVTYRFTLTANGCPNTQDVVVTVNPAAKLSSTLTPTAICSEATFSYAPSSTTTGATFTWVRQSAAGITSDGEANGSGNINQTLTNSTSNAINVIYKVTSGANGCSGLTEDVVVRVNPMPVATFSGVTEGQVVYSDGGNINLTPTGTPGGTFTIVSPSGTSGLSTNGTLTPCTALGTASQKSITIRYTVTLGTGSNACTASEEKTITLKKSSYTVLVEADPFPTCKGQNTTYTAKVYKDAEVIYPYLVNEDGLPVDANNNLLGNMVYPITNPAYFDDPNSIPKILYDNAYRFFQPKVISGTLMPQESFTYSWTKNMRGTQFGPHPTVSNAGLSSLDYYAVYVSGGSGTCVSGMTSKISNRVYTAAPIAYEVNITADRNIICQGGSVTLSANLNSAFSFWGDIGLTLSWMMKRGNDVTLLDTTPYNSSMGHVIQFPTTGPAGGFMTGDSLYVEFSSVIDRTNGVGSKCSRDFMTNRIVITVVEEQAMTVGGAYCAGGAGIQIGLTTTQSGVNYQLRRTANGNTEDVGSPITGTGGAISFGAQTEAGTYSVQALAGTEACLAFGAAEVFITPLPVVQTLTAANNGEYCSGGEGVSIILEDSQTGVSYQLRRTVNGTPTNVGSPMPGTNGQSINFGNQTEAGEYTVMATTVAVDGTVASCPQAMGSAMVTILDLPAITAQPQSNILCEGGSTSFSVTATGAGVTYQWQKNGEDMPNATNSTLILSNVQPDDAGEYTVIVSGTCSPAVTSAVASLTVNTAPVVTDDPAPLTVCEGETAAFSVAASGTDLTYVWRKNGAPIDGATGSTFVINSTTSSDGGNYSVTVAGICGSSVTTNVALLTVNTNPVISAQPVAVEVCAGGPATFSVGASGTGLAYQWLKNGEIIDGATEPTYSISSTDVGDADAYSVRITGTCSTVESNVAQLTINEAPSIVQVPLNQEVCSGQENVSFSVAANGTALSYQWYHDGRLIQGATESAYAVPVASDATSGTYTVLVSGTCTPPITQEATLTVNPLPTITVASSSACVGESSIITAEALNGSGDYTYSWIVPEGVTNPGSVTSFTTDVAGDYTVSVRDNMNNCPGVEVAKATVTLTPKEDALRGEIRAENGHGPITADNQIAVGDKVTFKVFSDLIDNGAIAAYKWYIGDGTDDGWVLQSDATTDIFIIDPVEEGEFMVKCEVLPGEGNCFNMHSVLMDQPIIPLPVELLYFNATKRGSDVVLDWATASEQDNKGFEVQVSSDAKTFRVLGFVESKVNTTSLKQTYSFVDKENGKQGVRYYRLKQVDLDGKVEFFNIKAVHFDEVSMNKVKAYPNPFHSEVELSIDAELDGELLITVTTATGQQLLQRSVQVAKGTNIEKLTLDPNLPRGVYIISTRMGDFNNHFKLLKQ